MYIDSELILHHGVRTIMQNLIYPAAQLRIMVSNNANRGQVDTAEFE